MASIQPQQSHQIIVSTIQQCELTTIYSLFENLYQKEEDIAHVGKRFFLNFYLSLLRELTSNFRLYACFVACVLVSINLGNHFLAHFHRKKKKFPLKFSIKKKIKITQT